MTTPGEITEFLSRNGVFGKIFGDRANPAIVVLTAMAGLSVEWWHLAEKGAHPFWVLTYDRLGYGKSRRPASPPSPKKH